MRPPSNRDSVRLDWTITACSLRHTLPGLRVCDPGKKGGKLKNEQVAELLYQALETEKGGIQIYETALKCAVNTDLKEEWEKYLDQTRNHEQIVLEVMGKLGLDPEKETPGREVVRHIGESLVQAMEMALNSVSAAEAAEIVACECVVLAETKDHLNWELIHEVAEKSKGEQREALKTAYEQVEEQEDEHLSAARARNIDDGAAVRHGDGPC